MFKPIFVIDDWDISSSFAFKWMTRWRQETSHYLWQYWSNTRHAPSSKEDNFHSTHQALYVLQTCSAKGQCRYHIPSNNTTWTRGPENDNTPQPLDQWTNNSLMGQQVGNCKIFTLTHYLADLFAMHRCCPRSIPLCIQHHIQTHIPFIPSESTLPYMRYSNFNIYLGYPRSRSSVRSKVKVTTWAQHPIHSNPDFSMSIRPPIPMTQTFSKFQLKNPRSRS